MQRKVTLGHFGVPESDRHLSFGHFFVCRFQKKKVSPTGYSNSDSQKNDATTTPADSCETPICKKWRWGAYVITNDRCPARPVCLQLCAHKRRRRRSTTTLTTAVSVCSLG